jgi:hypothetical protein
VPLFADEFGEISATTSTSTSITTTSSTVAASYNSLTVNRRHKKGHDRVKARRFQLKISIWRRRAEWIRTAAYPAVDLLKSDNDQVELIVPFASGDWGAVNKDDLWMLRMALSMEGVEAREGLPLYQFKFHPVLPPSNSPQ